MHDFTKSHGPGDILWGTEENRNDRREAVTALRHHRGANVLRHQLVPALADNRECYVKAGALFSLPAQQRDALAMFPEAGEHVSVVRLRLILVLGDLDKAAGNHDHRSAGQHGIDEGCDDQESGDTEHRASDRDSELTADEPEHPDEDDR